MTRILVIGSTALRHHYGGYPPMFQRDPKDIDYFVNSADATADGFSWPLPLLLNSEAAVGDQFSHPLLDDWFDANVPESRFATVAELYTIKVSHSSWELRNGSWDKHMSDIAWLQHTGRGWPRIDEALYAILYQVWQEVHGSKQLKLQMGKDAFFTDAVVRIWDHDSLHDSVAYGDQPMYLQVLKDGAAVDMDMAKVKALKHHDRVKLFREEVYATALERILVPRNYMYSARAAYAWALRRTITSLTRGWSSRWMIENYRELRVPDFDYVARHKSRMHLLIPYEEGKNGQ